MLEKGFFHKRVGSILEFHPAVDVCSEQMQACPETNPWPLLSQTSAVRLQRGQRRGVRCVDIRCFCFKSDSGVIDYSIDGCELNRALDIPRLLIIETSQTLGLVGLICPIVGLIDKQLQNEKVMH